MSEPALSIRRLSKCYRLGSIGRHTLVDELTYWLHRLRGRDPREHMGRVSMSASATEMRRVAAEKTGAEEFWALRDVSIDIHPGEIIGVIGRNGAGKSTLLKILSRITEPTSGEVVINGRIGSLLEVGTGFHPELTGRENIYMNGTILGMKTREIDAKFDEIVAFAEIERFLDTPVKRYSSGMYVRLAFAVAAHLEPEIMLVDEVLAVGDAVFQKRCLGKMSEVATSGRTVLFVSHQMNAIRSLCPRCLWLENGGVRAVGPTAGVVDEYLGSGAVRHAWRNEGDAYSSPYFKPLAMRVVDRHGDPLDRDIRMDESFGLVLEGFIERENSALLAGFQVFAPGGELIFMSLHKDAEERNWPVLRAGHNAMVAWVPGQFLNEGTYRVELNITLFGQEWICRPGAESPVMHFTIHGGLVDAPYWGRRRAGLTVPRLKFEILTPGGNAP